MCRHNTLPYKGTSSLQGVSWRQVAAVMSRVNFTDVARTFLPEDQIHRPWSITRKPREKETPAHRDHKHFCPLEGLKQPWRVAAQAHFDGCVMSQVLDWTITETRGRYVLLPSWRISAFCPLEGFRINFLGEKRKSPHRGAASPSTQRKWSPLNIRLKRPLHHALAQVSHKKIHHVGQRTAERVWETAWLPWLTGSLHQVTDTPCKIWNGHVNCTCLIGM